jgi:hypothetical protein
MSSPVFVVHGIGNRDRKAFETTVDGLRKATGDRWTLVPVYWGDLGADEDSMSFTIPRWPSDRRLGGGRVETRDGAAARAAAPAAVAPGGFDTDELREAVVAHLFAAPVGTPAPRRGVELRGGGTDGLPYAVVAGVERASAGAAEAGGVELRERAEEWGAAVVRVLAEAWPQTTWLRRVGDPYMLAEIGAAVAGSLADPGADHAGRYGYELRDAADVVGFLQNRIMDIDRLVGASVNSAAGRLNTYLRTEFGPYVHRFVGDTLVYQRDRTRIQQRVREVVAAERPGLGSGPDHPVQMIGHSFGGVVALDLAVDENPLWTRSLLTIGAQAPLFHVTDPRSPSLAAFQPAKGPVALPKSLGRWTNLWEPIDLLAFIAARVFTLFDGSPPTDVAVPHRASHGLWTHSAYWGMPELVDVMGDVFD